MSTPDPREPATFPRRVLLVSIGLSPQVLTETLYALAHRGPVPFLPTEVHVVTTREGRERTRLTLLSEDPGWFHRLRRDYGLPDMRFDEDTIHVVAGEVDDIRSPEHNEQAADGITQVMRELTADPQSALHVSIAGGRKTMGFYVGYALSIFGRPQDRLSHVLVSTPFEGLPEFYYPSPASRVIYTPGPNGRPLDTRDAVVTLSEIPFFSLRAGLPKALLGGDGSFRAAVEAARVALAPPELVLDRRSCLIRASGLVVRLPPDSFALLSVFASRCIEGAPPVRAPAKDVADRAWAEWYLRERRLIAHELDDLDRTEASLRDGMSGDNFSTRLSRLKRALEAQLGEAAQHYVVRGDGRPGLYALRLPPKAVRFDAVDDTPDQTS